MIKSIFVIVFIFSLIAKSASVEIQDVQIFNDQQYSWLYEQLLPENLRKDFPNESFKSFRVHLQDSYQNFPKPESILAKNLNPVKTITGTMLYVGIVRKKYNYDVLMTPNKDLVMNVRIHLQNPNAADEINFSNRLKEAEGMWNTNRVATDFNYSFKFELVKNSSQAHFSVFLLDSTRGPYDTFWSRDWTGKAIAHEIGHMLGLGDEYQTLTSVSDCLRPSLMCRSWTGELMPHHYYFVLRRLITEPKIN